MMLFTNDSFYADFTETEHKLSTIISKFYYKWIEVKYV